MPAEPQRLQRPVGALRVRVDSLSFRLALIAAVGSTIALLIAGFIFISLFRQSAEQNFDDRLAVLLRGLVGASITAEGLAAEEADSLGEPRFSLPQSGWYWQIRDAGSGEVVAASLSLFGNDLPAAENATDDGRMRRLTFAGPAGRQLRGLEQTIEAGPGSRYRVLVAGNADALAADIGRFRFVVAITLGALALLLAVGTVALVSFGLSPLRRMRSTLRRVRLGEVETLEGRYPAEIAPVVGDLNALLKSNREIIERSRTHVGNLAHALKTPLAVLQNEAGSGDDAVSQKVQEQTTIMRDQITHHLNRARMAAQSNVIGAVTKVEEVVNGLARVMRKVHQDRGLTIHVDIPGGIRFRGERHDFEEMVGNLVDNACKWADSYVIIRAYVRDEATRQVMVLTVVDDGPGLSEEAQKTALSRGARLDESKPGSGLGLSIVGELVRIYDGSVALESSETGGLRVNLRLPVATEDRL